jgi:hypothetical protein
LNAAEHAAEAHRLLNDRYPLGSPEQLAVLAEAQVHATLATVVPYVEFELDGELQTAEIEEFPRENFEQLLAAARVFLNMPSDHTASLDDLIAAVDAFGDREHGESSRG